MKKSILTTCMCLVLPYFVGYAQNPVIISQNLDLSNPEWGCPITRSSGNISFYQSDNSFKGTIEVRGLKPNNRYVLCINGKKNHQSNNLLKQAGYEEYKGEFKSDFFDFDTDQKGYCNKSFVESFLPKGNYDVKIFVKDKNSAYCAVLYRDIQIKFTIR